MRSFFRYFVDHPTAANLLMALMVVAGLAATTQIRSQFFPNVVIESVTIRVPWDDAGPEDIDEAIVEPLEPNFRELEGVDSTRTNAREGLGSIVVEFEPDHDMGQAIDEIEAAFDAAIGLPEDAEDETIRRNVFRDRVTNVLITGPTTPELLDDYAEELREALFARGVTRVGIPEEVRSVLRVEPHPAALERYGLSMSEISQAIAAEVEARPAGALAEGGARIRAGVKRTDVAALDTIVVRTLPDGGKLLLRDIATLRDDGARDGVELFHDGQPAIEMQVERSAEGDALSIQDAVEDAIAELSPTLPQGVEIRPIISRADNIAERLDILYRNGLTGLAIVVVLLFLFLSARTALWVAAGIPAAVLATIAIMYWTGFSLNMVSLFALIITLGIVVDDAIVVGEHADRLARDGQSPSDAATNAAVRMSSPVFSAMVTTLIAFGAMMVIGGAFGELIAEIPLTVCVVLIASLIECFLVLPAHMRHALAAQAREAWWDQPSRVFNRGFEQMREHVFKPMLRWALKARYAVVSGAVALLLLSTSLFVDGSVKWFFFNAPERATVRANLAMAAGAGREDTFAMLEEMRRALDVVDERYAAEHGAAPVVDHLARLGSGSGRGLASAESRDPDQLGAFTVELIDPDLRPYSQQDFLQDWRAEIQRPPLLEELKFRGERTGPGGDAISVELSGAPTRVLKEASEALKGELAQLAGVSSLEDSLPYDKPEYVLTLTPRGEALGFSTEALGAELRARLAGVTAAEFAVDGREIEIEVGLDEAFLNEGFLDQTFVPLPGVSAVDAGSAAATIALSDIVDVASRQGFASIKRLDGRRIVEVTGEVVDDAAAREAVDLALRDRILPMIAGAYSVDATLGGLKEQERRFLADAQVGFALCLVGIFLTLSWIFASWTRPFAIMFVIPFGLVGAIYGHYWHGVPLSMFSVVGLIGMAGIIINDSIVLITTIDEKTKRRPVFEAVIDGTADRLRAVMLTTLTTVGGLAPLLFETSRQALFLKPTVITLCYGLGFGMFLVLLLTPAFILIQHDVARLLRSARRMAKHLIRPRPGLGTGAV
ncbi:MAG: efflux RND transporter permease subunit [Pseudomonadota bacterium]